MAAVPATLRAHLVDALIASLPAPRLACVYVNCRERFDLKLTLSRH